VVRRAAARVLDAQEVVELRVVGELDPAAERAGLIDVVASSERELLDELEGFRVEGPKAERLRTAGLTFRNEIVSGPGGQVTNWVRRPTCAK